MNIVQADASHIEFISDFGSKSFIYAYQCTLPIEELRKYIDITFSKSTILEEINSTSVAYFICQDSDMNPCGYAKLVQSSIPEGIKSNSCIELQRLYVKSDYRGHGVGKLLELHAETYARNSNINAIWLRVWDGNVVAHEIYKKWKFEVVGNELYQVGKDHRTVLLMLKSLCGK